MPTLIALIRGINVGGKNSLPMSELVSELKKLGCSNIRTYIQSGNAVFSASEGDERELARKIADSIFSVRRFRPHVLVINSAELASAIELNPWHEEGAEAEGKALHIFFLDSVPKTPDLEHIKLLAASAEKWALQEKCFYLYSPEGFHKSKLAAKVEKMLGVPATARNWRSVRNIFEIATAEKPAASNNNTFA